MNKMRLNPIDYKTNTGQWRTRGLFIEGGHSANHGPEVKPIFTLKTHDIGSALSVHRLYVEMEDTTEYQFANDYFGGWEHWNELCQSPFFIPYLERMRDELTIKLKARTINNVLAIAKDPEAKGHLEANKFLLKEGYVDSEETSRSLRSVGRPKKTKSATEIVTEEINERKRIREDMKRLGLNS